MARGPLRVCRRVAERWGPGWNRNRVPAGEPERMVISSTNVNKGRSRKRRHERARTERGNMEPAHGVSEGKEISGKTQ